MMLQTVLLLVLLVSLGYWLVVWASARRFFSQPRLSPSCFAPAVSILKPVKGLDPHAYENFASFCRQQYPGPVEVLFGVNDAADPAVPIIEQLRADFPQAAVRLIIVPPGALNAKVGILDRLAREARNELLVVADADIRVRPNYLAAVTAPLANPRVGLVTCLYCGAGAENLAARLEALYINTVFLPEAILGTRWPGARFAFGSTMVLRRTDLERIGGYRAISDYLADDYQLAARIAGLGLEVRLSSHVVADELGSGRLSEYWRRQVRWARTIRVSRPREYPGLLLTYSTAFALLLAAASGWAAWALVLMAISIGVRWLVGSRTLAYAGAQVRARNLAWLPLADLMNAAVWAAGAVGNTIEWRGRRLRLLADGRLEELTDVPTAAAPRWFAVAVCAIDRRLRRRQRITEFTDDPRCLVRVSVETATDPIRLPDGTRLPAGTAFGDLHFWNEHVPPVPDSGPGLGWARLLEKRLRLSLSELADAAAERRDMQAIAAFRAELPVGTPGAHCRLMRMAGFVPVERRGPEHWLQRFVVFWQNVYLWALMRVFNPGGLRAGWVKRTRAEYWISRESLLGRYRARGPAMLAGG